MRKWRGFTAVPSVRVPFAKRTLRVYAISDRDWNRSRPGTRRVARIDMLGPRAEASV
jgi:hypothetical protein